MIPLHTSLYSYLRLYKYTPVQALFIVNGIRRRCDPTAKARLIQLCDRAIERLRAARQADSASTDHPGEHLGESLYERDARIDHMVRFIYERLKSEAGSRNPSARAAEAAALVASLFADGLGGHVRTSYRVQAQANLELAAELLSEAHADLVQAIGIRDTVLELDGAAAEFLELLDEESLPSRAEYRNATNAGNEALVQVVCEALADAGTETPADWTALRDLLKPLLDMNEEIHTRLLRRRAAARTVRGEGEGEGVAAAAPPPAPGPVPQGTQDPAVAATAEPPTTATPDTTVTPVGEPAPSTT